MSISIGEKERLTAVAARVMRDNPQLDARSVQEGVNAALQEVYGLIHERRVQWRDTKGDVAKGREQEAHTLSHLIFQLHGG